jgi:hypothetical protein
LDRGQGAGEGERGKEKEGQGEGEGERVIGREEWEWCEYIETGLAKVPSTSHAHFNMRFFQTIMSDD